MIRVGQRIGGKGITLRSYKGRRTWYPLPLYPNSTVRLVTVTPADKSVPLDRLDIQLQTPDNVREVVHWYVKELSAYGDVKQRTFKYSTLVELGESYKRILVVLIGRKGYTEVWVGVGLR